jgi:hypothetical protein
MLFIALSASYRRRLFHARTVCYGQFYPLPVEQFSSVMAGVQAEVRE